MNIFVYFRLVMHVFFIVFSPKEGDGPYKQHDYQTYFYLTTIIFNIYMYFGCKIIIYFVWKMF